MVHGAPQHRSSPAEFLQVLSMEIFHSFKTKEVILCCCSTLALPGGAEEEAPRADCAPAVEWCLMQFSRLGTWELLMLVLSLVQSNLDHPQCCKKCLAEMCYSPIFYSQVLQIVNCLSTVCVKQLYDLSRFL